jgi:hypothetical protein
VLRALELQLVFIYHTLSSFHAAQVFQGLLGKRSPAALRIRELVPAKLTIGSESARDAIASVMLIAGMALPLSASAGISESGRRRKAAR